MFGPHRCPKKYSVPPAMKGTGCVGSRRLSRTSMDSSWSLNADECCALLRFEIGPGEGVKGDSRECAPGSCTSNQRLKAFKGPLVSVVSHFRSLAKAFTTKAGSFIALAASKQITPKSARTTLTGSLVHGGTGRIDFIAPVDCLSKSMMMFGKSIGAKSEKTRDTRPAKRPDLRRRDPVSVSPSLALVRHLRRCPSSGTPSTCRLRLCRIISALNCMEGPSMLGSGMGPRCCCIYSQRYLVVALS